MLVGVFNLYPGHNSIFAGSTSYTLHYIRQQELEGLLSPGSFEMEACMILWPSVSLLSRIYLSQVVGL